MNSLATRRLDTQGEGPDLSKLEISTASDVQHDRREDMTSSEDDDYCDNTRQTDLTIIHGAETAPVLSDSESSLKRYFIDDRNFLNNLSCRLKLTSLDCKPHRSNLMRMEI